MAQQIVESKTEPVLGSSKIDVSSDKLLTAPVKKIALRELPNDNKVIVSTSIGPSSILKDKVHCTDNNRVSGTKRPSSDSSMNHNHPQSSGNNAGNGHRVYYRRKAEADLGKSTCVSPISSSRQPGEDETAQPKSQTMEPKVSCFPAVAPIPMASAVSASGKPSVPLSIGNSAVRLAPNESSVAVAAGHTIGNSTGLKNAHWEDRYHRLLMLLRKLDQSDQDEYIQSKPPIT